MNKGVSSIFNELRSRNKSLDNCFTAQNLPFSDTHKLGVSEKGYPMFFIHSSLTGPVSNYNLDLISVLFNQHCSLILDDVRKEMNNVYTIVALKTDNPDLVNFFLDVICIVLDKIGDEPNPKLLESEIEKLVKLFHCFSKPPKKTIQGLWAELFVIEHSALPEYLIQAWHTETNDIFDFNDGIDKLEVKSTSKSKRIHSFSLNQLSPNQESNLIIASLFVLPSGKGLTIFDLMDSIEKKLTSLETKIKLDEIVSSTLGVDFEKAGDFYYDYQSAADSYNLYYYKDIPSIPTKEIPLEISNIHFECDLTKINSLSAISSKFSNSKLFKSI